MAVHSAPEISPNQFRRSSDVDDTASFLRAFDFFRESGVNSRQAGGTLRLRGGYTVSDTILIASLGVTLKGEGWGNSLNPTSGTWIRWNGPSGKPLVKLQQTINTGLDNIRLIGNSAAKPSGGIEFADIGTDAFFGNYLSRVWIGDFYGYDTDATVQFQNGIVCTGTINGDSNVFNHVRIQGCSNIGFDIQNQNWGGCACSGLYINGCRIGLQLNTVITGTNWFFGNCTDTCFRLLTGARVSVTDFLAESCTRLATFDDTHTSGRFVIRGGSYQTDNAGPPDGRYIDTGSSSGWNIHLEDFTQQTIDGFTGATPRIRAYNVSGGPTTGVLRIIGTRGIYPPGMELGSLVWSNDCRHVFYEPAPESGLDSMPKQSWQGNYYSGDTTFKVFSADSPGRHMQRGGPFIIERAGAPNAPAAAAQVGSGATNYSYKITALTYDGESAPSAAATCTNAATLGAGNVNRITWHPVPGAYAYRVYGRTAGAELLLKTVNWDDWHTGVLFPVIPPQWDDDGSSTPSAALPVSNTTGNLVVQGMLALGVASAARAQVNFAAATAPAAPANGDMWFDGTNLKIRIAGVTKTVTVA